MIGRTDRYGLGSVAECNSHCVAVHPFNQSLRIQCRDQCIVDTIITPQEEMANASNTTATSDQVGQMGLIGLLAVGAFLILNR